VRGPDPRIAALRGARPIGPLPLGGHLLPRARLRAGRFAQVGHLLLLGITAPRYVRELRRGVLDVFALGDGLYCLEVPPGHAGPPEDYLQELPA
jgi:hypothetical protein